MKRAAAILSTVAFAASWYRHTTFRSMSFDMAVFEQAVWKLAHGHAPMVTLVGWNAFADHLSPVLLVFAALYRIAATPVWFFAAQAIAFGAGLLLLPRLLEALNVGQRHQRAFLVAYALNPLMWNAVLFDFHPTTLVVPVFIYGATAALRHDRRGMVIAVVGAILLRDDMAAAAACIAALGWRQDRNGRWFRAGLAVSGLAWMAIGGAIGAAMGADRYWPERYGYAGASPTDALLHPWHSIPAVLSHLFTSQNGHLIVWWLLPLAALPLLRPAYSATVALLALPILVATDGNVHGLGFHYGAPLVAFLLVAAGAGFTRLETPRIRDIAAVGVVVLSVLAFAAIGPLKLSSIRYTAVDGHDARAAIATIPPGAGVVATTFLAPQVARRDLLLPFPYPFLDADRNFPLNADVARVSPTAQAKIDVVLVGPAVTTFEAPLIRAFADAPAIREQFTKERYGSVMLFRRVTAAPSAATQ